MREPIDGRRFSYVKCVLIGLIDLGEAFDQIDRVGFIAGELGSDGMRVNSDVHERSGASVNLRWRNSAGNQLALHAPIPYLQQLHHHRQQRQLPRYWRSGACRVRECGPLCRGDCGDSKAWRAGHDPSSPRRCDR